MPGPYCYLYFQHHIMENDPFQQQSIRQYMLATAFSLTLLFMQFITKHIF